MNINGKKQQQYHNRNAKDLSELTTDSKVLVLQENDTWLSATDKCIEPRSYIVEMKATSPRNIKTREMSHI